MPRRSGVDEQVTSGTSRRRSDVRSKTLGGAGTSCRPRSTGGSSKKNVKGLPGDESIDIIRKKAKVTFFEYAVFEIRNIKAVEDEPVVKEVSTPGPHSSTPGTRSSTPTSEMSSPKVKGEKPKETKQGKRKKSKKIQLKELTLEERRLVHFRNGVPFQYGKEEHLPMDYSSLLEMNRRNLNDILDLNEGEKEMMNIWNDYIHNIHGRGLVHLNSIISNFIDDRAQLIFQRNLYRNFVLLLNSMAESCLIDTESCFQFIIKIQGHLQPSSDSIRRNLNHPVDLAPALENTAASSENTAGRGHPSSPSATSTPSGSVRPPTSPSGSSSRPRSSRSTRPCPNSNLNSGPGCTSPGRPSSSPSGEGHGSTAKRGLWANDEEDSKSGPRFNPADPLASNLASDPGTNLQEGARLTSRITSSLSSLQRSSRNVIEKIRNVSSILDDKVGLDPLVLELSESDGEESKEYNMELDNFIASFNNEDMEEQEDLESEIPLLTIIPKTGLQTTRFEAECSGEELRSEDLNLDRDFLVLCNIENQPPPTNHRKKKKEAKKEPRGSPFCEVTDLLSDHEDLNAAAPTAVPAAVPQSQPSPATVKKRSRSESKPLVRILEGNSAKKAKRSNSSSALIIDKVSQAHDQGRGLGNSQVQVNSTKVPAKTPSSSCAHFRSSPDLEVSFPGLDPSETANES